MGGAHKSLRKRPSCATPAFNAPLNRPCALRMTAWLDMLIREPSLQMKPHCLTHKTVCPRFLSPAAAIPHNLILVKVSQVGDETDLAGLTSLVFYHMRTNCPPGMSQGAKSACLQSPDGRSHNLHQDIDVLTAAVKISDGARDFSCSSGAVCSRSQALPGRDWLTFPFVLSV